MVISSVAPNNSLTAPLMHSKMPIETAGRQTTANDRPTGGRRDDVAERERETLSLSAVKKAECLSIHTENYGLLDFRPE